MLESQKGQVSKVANNINAVYQQYVSNKALALNQPAGNNVVNCYELKPLGLDKRTTLVYE